MPALLRGITSNHNGDFYCLNCSQSYSTKNKLKEHERVWNNHDYCYVEISNEDNKILKYNQGEKSFKAEAIIYADLFCLKKCIHVKIIMSYLVKRKQLSTRLRVSHCLQIVHLMQQNKLDCYIGEDCMERFCKDLKDHAIKIINYEEKKMIPLTDKENKSYEE